MASQYITFAGVCLLLAMVPGPGALVVIRQAIKDGRPSALMTLLGNETALIFWGLAAAAGLTALIAASRLAYEGMRLVGAAVLLVLGVQAILQARRSEFEEIPIDAVPEAGRRGSTSARRAYLTGLVANLTNPKAAVFALSFLPQFGQANLPPLASFSILSAIWATVDFAWFAVVILFIGMARDFFGRTGVRRWLMRLSGGALIALGARLALGD